MMPAQNKNSVLESFARRIEQSTAELLESNCVDLRNAEAKSLSRSLRERLRLDQSKIRQMVESVRQVAVLEDPVGHVLRHTLLDDGLELRQLTVPFGTVAAIVESRPDAVVQLISLALKSGNALIVKAGQEANATVAVIDQMLREVLTGHGLGESCVSVIHGREAVAEILKLDEWIDLVVPRGNKELIRYVQENTRIPMIGHADGVCHIYIDAAADRQMAVHVIIDAKTQAPSTCNAVETVLVHRDAMDCVPMLADALQEAGVSVRGCSATAVAVGDGKVDVIRDDQEWATEYGDMTIAIKVVDNMEEALDHIARFGSHHTDAIITQNPAAAAQFIDEVDSAGVFHNASTRFADGFRYGLGAEVGISTGKLPPRGPVGLQGLVTYKWVLHGQGHVVADYVGIGAKPFKHITLGSGDVR
jgi:glutamate-5-semialdehyde dehydrogenase